MADPTVSPSLPTAVSTPAAPTPAPATPPTAPASPPSAVASPASPPEQAPSTQTAAPVAATAEPAPAPAQTTPASTPAPTTPEATSLLSDAGKPTEAPKPATQPTAPVALPTYEAFKLADGTPIEKAQGDKFNAILGKFETTTKADHAAMQAFGQEMIALYESEVKRATDASIADWTRMRDGWRTQFIQDKDLGGTNQQATLKRCGDFIREYGGTHEQIVELQTMLAQTGAGDHPALIRLLNTAAKVLGEGRMVPASNPKNPAASATKSQRRYSNSLNGAN